MRGLILAAGLGERLRPLTLTRAKPALEFLNAPMMAYPYHWLDTLGLTDLTLNTHHLPDTVRAAAARLARPGLRLHFTFEPVLLGSGGGIWNAREHLRGDPTFAVANGDAVVLFEDPSALGEMRALHEREEALATLLTCPLPGVGEKIPGVWTDANHRVIGFGKSKPRPDARCAHYASFMLLSDRVWDHFPAGESNILYDVLLPRIAAGDRVLTHHLENLRWFETGNAHDYLAATEACLKEWRDQTAIGRAVGQITARFADAHSARTDLTQLRLIADSAEIDPEARLEGFSVIGANARVGAGARVEGGVVLPGARVAPGLTLRDAVSI